MAGQIYPVVQLPEEPALSRYELLTVSPTLDTPHDASGAARPLDGGVRIRFSSTDPKPSVAANDCPITHASFTNDDGPLQSADFASFTIWNALQCSVIGGLDLEADELGQEVLDTADDWIEWVFATQLFSGTAVTANDNLNDLATVVTNDEGGLGGAIAAVSRAYADFWGSNQAMIHIPTVAFDAHASINLPYPLETARGHRVVTSSAYASDLLVPTTGGSAGNWVYATPTIYHYFSGLTLVGEPEITGIAASTPSNRDIMERLATAYGVIAFAPYGVYASKVA